MPPLAEHATPQRIEREDGAGAIIGAIIIVILLVFGALYFWGQKLNNRASPNAPLVQNEVVID